MIMPCAKMIISDEYGETVVFTIFIFEMKTENLLIKSDVEGERKRNQEWFINVLATGEMAIF